MRHSAATIMLEHGVALAVVQEIPGHSDIRVTRGYTHVSSPLAEDVAAWVGRLFRRKVSRKMSREHTIPDLEISVYAGQVEPPWGIEPQTYSLRVNRSAD